MQLGIERIGDGDVQLAVHEAEREDVQAVRLVLGHHPGRVRVGRVLADVDDLDARLLADGAGERDLVEESVGDERLAEPARRRALDRVLDGLPRHPVVDDEDVAEPGPVDRLGHVGDEPREASERGRGGRGASLQRHAAAPPPALAPEPVATTSTAACAAGALLDAIPLPPSAQRKWPKGY